MIDLSTNTMKRLKTFDVVFYWFVKDIDLEPDTKQN